MIFSKAPLMVTTILGSCVSVVMFHPRTEIGAMCHGLLPVCRCEGGVASSHQSQECFRYVDCSIHYMLVEFENNKIPARELVIKLFGGADMFRTNQEKSVGKQNVIVARNILRVKNLSIASEDVGGEQGRKLFFFTNSGEVRLKRLGKNREHYHEFQQQLQASMLS